MKVLKIKKQPTKPVIKRKKEIKDLSEGLKQEYCHYSGLPSPNFYQTQ